MNNNWIVVGDCTVSGLENLDANTAVSCSTSGNTATIQNFAGFEGAVEISVEFDDVVPPINNGGGDIQYPHVSTITSYYIGGRIIDSLISSVNSCTVSARGDIGISTML